MKKTLTIIGLLLVLGLLYLGWTSSLGTLQTTLKDSVERVERTLAIGLGSNANRSTSKCTVSSVTAATVNGTASTPVAEDLTRAWTRIQSAEDGLVVNLAFGSTATTGNGIRLTSSTPYVDIGLNTDIPYTGSVSAISSATTTLYLTECTY